MGNLFLSLPFSYECILFLKKRKYSETCYLMWMTVEDIMLSEISQFPPRTLRCTETVGSGCQGLGEESGSCLSWGSTVGMDAHQCHVLSATGLYTHTRL